MGQMNFFSTMSVNPASGVSTASPSLPEIIVTKIAYVMSGTEDEDDGLGVGKCRCKDVPASLIYSAINSTVLNVFPVFSSPILMMEFENAV
jgi:hypothetical protein